MSKVITVPEQELFIPPDKFVTLKETTFKIEHSLVAIAKWEAKWHVPFLDANAQKTNEMIIDYIKCMTISQNVNPIIYEHLPEQTLQEINEYIDDPMTATWFTDSKPGKGTGEVITSELVYYWMIAQNIPPEYDKWHFNRLMTLIRVCSEKNSPSKKMSRKDILSRNKALNAARRKASGSRG